MKTEQTLFGRDVKSFVKADDGIEAKVSGFYTTLPIDVNPKIFEDTASFRRKVICAVANSTATLKDGKKILHAVSYKEVDPREFAFNICNSDEEGRDAMLSDIKEYYTDLEKILNGEHEDFWVAEDEHENSEEPVQDEFWQDKAKDYLGCSDLEAYKTEVKVYDKLILDEAEKNELTWQLVKDAFDRGSYVAQEFVKKGLDEVTKELSEFGFDGIKVLEPDGDIRLRPVVIGINDLYIGGNKDDKSANDLYSLIDTGISGRWGGLDMGLPDMELRTDHVNNLYGSINFLRKQGYLDHADKLFGMISQTLRKQFYETFDERVNNPRVPTAYHIDHLNRCLKLAKEHDPHLYASMIQFLKDNDEAFGKLCGYALKRDTEAVKAIEEFGRIQNE